MKQIYSLVFFCFFSTGFAVAQTDSAAAKRDSLQKDSLRRKTISTITDSLPNSAQLILQTDSLKIKDSIRVQDSIRLVQRLTDSLQKKMQQIQTLQNLKDGEGRIFYGKEYLFYYLIFLFLLFGLIRRAFSKYFYDLFRVFFKTTLKQKQTQELLLQSPLPSVVMNSFFWVLWFLNHRQHGGTPWPVWCMVGWGIGLAFSYYNAYMDDKITAVDKEYEKLKNKGLQNEL